MQTMLTLAAAGRGGAGQLCIWRCRGRPAVHAVWLETRRRGSGQRYLRLYRSSEEAEEPFDFDGNT